jgi:hypothetical protein
MAEENDFMSSWYETGDSLYSAYADLSHQDFNPDFPDIPMFDPEGQYNPSYKQAFEDAGGNLTFKSQSSGGYKSGTPRDLHYETKMWQHEKLLPSDIRKDLLTVKSLYHDVGGGEPLYQGDSLVSPYQMQKKYTEGVSGLSLFEKSDWESEVFSPMLASYNVGSPISDEQSIINELNKLDEPNLEGE